jgi:hypothetical protein
MRKTLIGLALMLGALASCQAVPAERKNNCACLWQRPYGSMILMEGVKA